MRPRALIAPVPRRSTREPVVPMINVVFLLLIFFLMTAQIVLPAPFDVTLPNASGAGDETTPTLYLSAEGEIAFETTRGAGALAQAVQRAQALDSPLRLVADADLPAEQLANTLGQVTRLGATEVTLVTQGG